jgi:hypothetical protein
MKQQYPTALPSKKDVIKKPDILAKSAYLLFYGAASTLISLLSIIFIFALVSLLANDPLPGITIPEKIPNWGAVTILLMLYIAIVLPLKALRFKFSPHKPYSLYGSESSPKHGDATLWLALFILLGWFASEHQTEIYAALGSFPAWWRNFVDSIGPWFYQ